MKCAVITPVGPGHAELFAQVGGPSVEQARAYDTGPFSEILHYVMDDTVGRHGRSARRNEALQRALDEGVDWVFFLDADDKITPNAFEAFGRVIAAEPELDAVWGLICTLDRGGEPELREGQAATIDSREEFLSVAPFNGVQIGGFYRTQVVARFGFDVGMNTGEDYKLYCQLWNSARCAKRPEIFFLNQRGLHSTGPRSATGQDWNVSVSGQWIAQLSGAQVFVDVGGDAAAAPARMRLTNPADPSQAAHLRGEFFERDALGKLKALLHTPAPSIVDVGPGGGNHLVWCARNLQPERLIAVETDRAASDLLGENLAANGLAETVQRRSLHAQAAAPALEAAVFGTGLVAAPARSGEEGRASLDAVLGDAPVDALRIDAVGTEIETLEGAAAVIARARPVVWVKVAPANAMRFLQGWCRGANYRVVDSVFGAGATDYFAVPKEAP